MPRPSPSAPLSASLDPPHTLAQNRVVFLDWLRGFAALTMLQGHTFDAMLRPELRNGGVFMFSQFIGGEVPAIFLLLTGVTYGMGMHKREHLPPWQRVLAALKRARYLFVLAVLFRVQMWIDAWGTNPWTDMLRVDILNLMAVSATLLSILALAKGRSRVLWAVGAGVAIAALSPLAASLASPGFPQAIRDYLVPSGVMFGIFPWGAYFAFGAALGGMVPMIKRDAWDHVMQWFALGGITLLVVGRYFGELPWSIYSASQFWLNSPALVACKLGIALLALTFAFIWTEYCNIGWSWLRQVGTTSLVVYWVHIELVYGKPTWFMRPHLDILQCVLFSAALMVAMVALSVAVTGLKKRFLHRAPDVPVWELSVRGGDKRRRHA